MEVFKAPQRIKPSSRAVKIFLAGSIEMGTAKDWQEEVTHILKGIDTKQIEVFNPRRDIFDADLDQSFENAVFNQQVTWELNALDRADIIIMNLLPETKSPISLLELGLNAKSGKLRVCCPKEFWRSGNVEIVCDRFNIPLFETLSDLMTSIRKELK